MSKLKERLLSKDYGKIIRNLIIAMALVAIVSVLFIAFFAIPELETANTYCLETAILFEPVSQEEKIDEQFWIKTIDKSA